MHTRILHRAAQQGKQQHVGDLRTIRCLVYCGSAPYKHSTPRIPSVQYMDFFVFS